MRVRRGSLSLATALLVAGLLFTASARQAHGSADRSDSERNTSLYQSEVRKRDGAEARVQELTEQIDKLTVAEGTENGTVAAVQRQANDLAARAGMTEVRGRTVTVTLDDAPPGRTRDGFRPDELVVHQQDVQAVINALWSGGATAVTLMGRRLIATTAVRCVGNTLLLQDTLYSPPYVVVAVGAPDDLQRALDLSPDVALYRDYVEQVGLGYTVERTGEQTLPAFTGSTPLEHATLAE
jgi:uncharacterized protein YlxW (UPF0749 family)